MLINILFAALALVCGPLYVVTAGRAFRWMRHSAAQPSILAFYVNTWMLSLSGTFFIVGLAQLLS